MNKQSLFYILAGLVASGTIASVIVASNSWARSSASSTNILPSSRLTPETQILEPASQLEPAVPISGSPASYPTNRMAAKADQHFIEMMIPHHQTAVDMANLALTRATHPELKKLAEAIKLNQTREIEQMRFWYRSWYGSDVPAISTREMGMMGNGSGMGGGMMRSPSRQSGSRGGMMQTDLEALKNAPDFDKEFIRQMIPHHQMAVHMSQMVLNHSTRPEIRTLATSIIKNQTAEIRLMQQWYPTW